MPVHLRRTYFSFITCFLLTLAFSGGLSYAEHLAGYPANDIPDSLKLNANAVVRESSILFTYKSSRSTSYKNRLVITILNSAGEGFGEFRKVYDRFSKISFLRGNIYDAGGILIRKIRSADMKDFSNSSESALFDDNRVLYYQPLVSTFPYTVEYEYEISISGSFGFPRWSPVLGYDLAVQESEFTVVLPSDYSFRFIENHFPSTVSITNIGKNKKYRWELFSFKARERESFSPSFSKIFPNVLTAPSEFELGGYHGNLESWNSFAQWLSRLNEGRDKLLPATIEKVHALVKGISDEREKTRLIYKYLQSKTRYVSIQLGIGGWQPIEASIVDEVGYGDCKALSNYAIALLKAAGIKAYYALVNSGASFTQLREDFPSNQFDHVIVCVPQKSDTLWLECTSQIDPFNFLGDFTSDRKVLLIKETGGELVRTKVYPQSENFQLTNAKVVLNFNGHAHAWASTKFGGLQLSDIIAYVHLSKEDQKKWLYNEIKIPNFQLVNFSIFGDSSDKSEARVKMEIELGNYATTSGKRLFLPLNLLSRSEFLPLKARDRKQDILINEPVINIDSVVYILPSGVTLEYVPEPVSIKTDFGEYTTVVYISQGIILYLRKFILNKGLYEVKKYPAFLKFFHDISNEDNNKLVLVKTGY